ncbi:hypothetical protein PhiCrAssBcn1_59 [Bacteroides phage PhiCrAssBcn1]|nr:hypothetical protein PhiCrAssBcn4_99 [Bacteroides phage PhiCrAssBcn4]WCF56960.1 hypothetical protein PhiCrAssBcn9_9 [Bacteroides phage PhiCrAssBcn9]WCF57123.1 hypothetical protein PhiCrAssBcn13_71 [Bacteroides phage PhiCrAssBcn13]WCF57286.1 hypothetical protein PhiCrAssBcn24_31 [Bacteroides phage PhiCrAssBcn24]WCF57415.1 hypothetical protein PhiCrAssBcn1_59 [Bacteroides phage PhiCrAssBcn1]WCF57492.1 hypothetical protein PhiCrAssBcn2_35 [Bacteroides phage PhiCrAssBcn2]WCF57656.1 hypothetica
MNETAMLVILLVVGILIMPYYVSHTGPSPRDKERKRIQEEIWDLERKQDASYTSYSPSRQDRIDYLTQLLKEI